MTAEGLCKSAASACDVGTVGAGGLWYDAGTAGHGMGLEVTFIGSGGAG